MTHKIPLIDLDIKHIKFNYDNCLISAQDSIVFNHTLTQADIFLSITNPQKKAEILLASGLFTDIQDEDKTEEQKTKEEEFLQEILHLTIMQIYLRNINFKTVIDDLLKKVSYNAVESFTIHDIIPEYRNTGEMIEKTIGNKLYPVDKIATNDTLKFFHESLVYNVIAININNFFLLKKHLRFKY